MGLRFNPGLLVDGEFFELPQPVTQLRVQDHWDFSRFGVILSEGNYTTGLTRRGVDLAVAGQVGRANDLLLLSEAEMFAAIEQLRTVIDSQREARFPFFLYRDATTESCRYFRDCSVARFQYDLSQPELYGYTLTIHADDPVLYETWPD